MREHAHQLLDRLGDGQLAVVVHLLEVEVMVDPLSCKLADAPFEDEEISEEEERAVAESRERLKNNRPIAHEEVLADFGLSMADFERMGLTAPAEPTGSRR